MSHWKFCATCELQYPGFQKTCPHCAKAMERRKQMLEIADLILNDKISVEEAVSKLLRERIQSELDKEDEEAVRRFLDGTGESVPTGTIYLTKPS